LLYVFLGDDLGNFSTLNTLCIDCGWCSACRG